MNAQSVQTESPIAGDSLISSSSREKDLKVERDFKPSAVKIGVDALAFGRTVTTSGFSQYEIQSDIDFDRYFFVVDIGRESNSLSNSEFSYSNSGNYFRLGLQVNMMPYNVDRSFFFFGFRYARSNFSHELNYVGSFDNWGNQNFDISNGSLSARWFETNMGMKVKVFENIFFGWTIRFKIAKKISGISDLEPRNIPGFGLADKGGNAGFNYYILYNIPFRDKPVPPRPKRKFKKSSSGNSSFGGANSFQRPF